MGLLLVSYTRVFLSVFGNRLMAFPPASLLCLYSPGCQVDRTPPSPPSERSGWKISGVFLSVVSFVFFLGIFLVYSAWLAVGPFIGLLLLLNHPFLCSHSSLGLFHQPFGFPLFSQGFILLGFRADVRIGICPCFFASPLLNRLMLVLMRSLASSWPVGCTYEECYERWVGWSVGCTSSTTLLPWPWAN